MSFSKDFVIGTCMDMCPTDEIIMRERENLLHQFEILPGNEKDIPKAEKRCMVKSFARSAAGKNLEVPENIRPPNVLLETVYYLLHDICGKKHESWITIYDFIMDRLRAVRQDLVIQNSSAAHYIIIFQPIIRFYAYASYRLCEENINEFDPHINNVHLQECLKRLLYAYDDLNYISERDGNDRDVFNVFLDTNRPYFESLYILLNLGNSTAILRGLQLSKIWRTELVKLSLDISLAYSSNNFVRVCRLFEKLPILHAAVVYLQVPELRKFPVRNHPASRIFVNLVIRLRNTGYFRGHGGKPDLPDMLIEEDELLCLITVTVNCSEIIQPLFFIISLSEVFQPMLLRALRIMSVAYNSKNLTFPVNVLEKMLLYDSTEKLRKECKYYGLQVTEIGICFTKSDFDNTKNTVSPNRSKFIEEQLQGIDITELLLNDNITL